MPQEEAVPESLKNILLVMADGGYLVPPADNEKPSEIWEETWKRVDRFLPDLFQEIFPEVKTPATVKKDVTGPEAQGGGSLPVRNAPSQEGPGRARNEEQAASKS